MGNHLSEPINNTLSKSASLGTLDKMLDRNDVANSTDDASSTCFRLRTYSNNITREPSSELTMSHSMIRRDKQKVFREQRPRLTDHQITLLMTTWVILKKHVDHLGADIFIR